MKIRFCEHNKGSKKAFSRLKGEFPGLNIKRKECLKKCGPCHKAPFAVIDGKVVCAIDNEELYKKIVTTL